MCPCPAQLVQGVGHPGGLNRVTRRGAGPPAGAPTVLQSGLCRLVDSLLELLGIRVDLLLHDLRRMFEIAVYPLVRGHDADQDDACLSFIQQVTEFLDLVSFETPGEMTPK